jgi:hypothetical protein
MNALLLVAAFASLNAIPSKGPAPTMEVTGVVLGAPLSMPECNATGSGRLRRYVSPYSGTPQVRPCYKARESLLERPGSPIGPEPEEIDLLLSNLPRGVQFDRTKATVIDGEIHALQFITTGISSQDSLFALLTEKYGEPVDVSRNTVTTRVGVDYQAIYAMWKYEDLLVTFVGVAGSIDRGGITFVTAKGHAHEQAEQAAKKAAEPGF